VVSAHRTPDWLFEYAATAEARGLRAIIAGAGGAAHLPGMLAAKTLVPVLGVPCRRPCWRAWTRCCRSCRCRPACRWARWPSGSRAPSTAALLAAQLIATGDPALRARLQARRDARRDEVLAQSLPPVG
jgi:5-(carboxyamino)imidazole ribonucleotide mutase